MAGCWDDWGFIGHRVTELQTPNCTQYMGGWIFCVPDFNKLHYSLRSQGDKRSSDNHINKYSDACIVRDLWIQQTLVFKNSSDHLVYHNLFEDNFVLRTYLSDETGFTGILKIYRRLSKYKQLGGLIPVLWLGVPLRCKATKLVSLVKHETLSIYVTERSRSWSGDVRLSGGFE